MGIFFLEVNRFFINLGLYRNCRKAEEFCFFFSMLIKWMLSNWIPVSITLISDFSAFRTTE